VGGRADFFGATSCGAHIGEASCGFFVCTQGAEADHRPARGGTQEAALDMPEASPGSSRVSFFSFVCLIPFFLPFL
jgi:hypothetical protein